MKTEDNIISDWLQSNNNPQIEIKVLNELVDKLIQQRDDFAIDFLHWSFGYEHEKDYYIKALKEFKKEKGL